MRPHPKLVAFKNAKYIKAFSKTLKGIESDLNKLGATDLEAYITAFDSPKSLVRRFFDPGYGDLEEVLTVVTRVHGCPVEIGVPMGKTGVAPPFVLHVVLPVPITGLAEYRRGTLHSKWHLEPENKSRIADLKRTLPKVRMQQTQTSRSAPVQVVWKVEAGQILGPTGDGRTEWIVQSGYEGGLLTGGNRPMVGKYLEAIPAVEGMLRKWAEAR